MAVAGGPHRDEVWLAVLDPTQETEIQKTRPGLVISPDEMNQYLRTVIIAPMTTVTRPYYPTRGRGAISGENESRWRWINCVRWIG
jgi:mRNA interferase MazF